MAATTAIEVVERSARPPANFGHFLEVVKPRLADVLPAHINPETLIRVVQTFGNQNEKLLKCTESSLLTSLMLCSQLGLPPNTPEGLAWLIPFWNGRQKTMECKVMFGYKGLAQLVRNTGEINRMNSGLVYEHEVINGTFVATEEPPDIIHRPSLLAKSEDYADDKLVAAYALIITKDGGRVQRILRRDEILKRRDASQAVQRAKKDGYKTPWDDWFGPQCRKTALRALCGAAEVPKNTKLVTALTSDVDSPAFDELQQVTLTQAEGFRQRAALAAPAPASAPELRAPQDEAPTQEQQEPDSSEKSPPKEEQPKMASQAQVSRLWKRWAKITDFDPKNPTDVDKTSFQGFVGHRIGEEKAKDSSTWTVQDYDVINKALDEYREKDPEPSQEEETDPPASAAPAVAEEEKAPEISQSDALKQLKDLRAALGMSWDQVREIATGLGVTAKASAKWSAKDCLSVIDGMRSAGAAEPEGADDEPPPAETEPEAETQAAAETDNEPPPLGDDDIPDDELDND